MLKLIAAGIWLVPAHALAATGAARGLESLAATLFTVLPILVVIGVVISVGIAFASGRINLAPLALLLMLPAMSMMRAIVPELERSQQPNSEPDEPGVFDWIGNHWLALLFGAFAVGGVAYLSIQHFERGARRRQVKVDRRELLATLAEADELLQYWTGVVMPPKIVKGERDRVSDIQSALEAVRDRLMPVLEQVQAGQPMNEVQRNVLEKDGKLLKDRADAYSIPTQPNLKGEALSSPAAPAFVPNGGQKVAGPSDEPTPLPGLIAPLAAMGIFGHASSACAEGLPVDCPEPVRHQRFY